MHRFKRIFKTGIKVASIAGGTGTVLGFGYLQYVNNVLGPINIEHDEAITYYK